MERIFTEEDRKKQAQNIREWAPWENSSGPKTEYGKSQSRMNAMKDGLRSQGMMNLTRSMKQQQETLGELQEE